MSIDETPHKGALSVSYLKDKPVRQSPKQIHKILYPLQVGYRPFGENGTQLSEHWPQRWRVSGRHRPRPLDVDD
jgi:hypothetical protein